LKEGCLGLPLFRRLCSAVFILLLSVAAGAQASQPEPASPKIALDVSETLFTFFAGLNSCGYDQELAASDPIRDQVRADVIRAVAASPEAQQTQKQLCEFIHDHQTPELARTITPYVSLALYTTEPSEFKATVKEADLPPDAQNVLGYLPAVQRFYNTAHLHQLWTKYQPQYESYVERFHEQVSSLIVETDSYLRLPISGYVSRRFAVYIEPLIAPSEINARNYGADYLMVIAPDHGKLKMEQVRHSYLHYTLDPLALKRANRMQRLKPLLASVKDSPMDATFKNDIALLVTECLIRAVEVRTMPVPNSGHEDKKQREKRVEEVRSRAVDAAVQQGFVLTRYFFDQFSAFEKGEVGFQDAFGDMLYGIDLGREEKRAGEVTFAKESAPDLVRQTVRPNSDSLDAAEERLIAGDAAGAQEIATKVVQDNSGDIARANFILARSASMQGKMQDAIDGFQRALQFSRDPRTLAWSHIYLARIFDIQEDRETALKHYNAALNTGDKAPDTKAAAERGLQKPYELPNRDK
jgi:hypothetical protein